MAEIKLYARPDGWHYHTDRNCLMLASEEYERLGYTEITMKEAKKRKLRPHTCTDKKHGFIEQAALIIPTNWSQETLDAINEAKDKGEL